MWLWRVVLIGLIVSVIVTACSDSGTGLRDRIPVALTIQGEVPDSSAAGQPLPSPLRVLVEDTEGEPMEGVEVSWDPSSGGGAIGRYGVPCGRADG